MSKRNRREHGRIISVETLTRGDALAADVAAGATSITVNDAGDFDEDGGWLYIGAQVVAYLACDDETGVITLADPLEVAGEEGDPVCVWSDLYDETVEYQQALVELDGDYDNPDPVVAEVAEGVGDLPEGDRGKAGESCTLLRVSGDEWEIVGVGGRSRKSRGSRWEHDDLYTLTAADVTAGTATVRLTRLPDDESVDAKLNGLGQPPTEYGVDYLNGIVTWPLSGWEKADDLLAFHYTYRKRVATTIIPDSPPDPAPPPDPADPANFFIPITGTVSITSTGGGGPEAATSISGSGAVWDPANSGYVVVGGWYTSEGVSYFGTATGQAEYHPELPAWDPAFKVYLLMRLGDIAFKHYYDDNGSDSYALVPETMQLPIVKLLRAGTSKTAESSATADTFTWSGWDAIQVDTGFVESMYSGIKATSYRTKVEVRARSGYPAPTPAGAREARQWTITEVAILVVTGG